MFWVFEAINEASEASSIINISHILHVITDVKALCTIFNSSGNIQIKNCSGLADSLAKFCIVKIRQKLSIQRVSDKDKLVIIKPFKAEKEVVTNYLI